MQKIKKLLIYALTALFTAVCFLLGIFILVPNNVKAMTDSNAVKVGINGELTELSTDAGEINVDVLNNLYEKLAGSGATLSSVKGLAATPANTSGSSKRWYAGYNAEQLRSQNSNNDIIVKFGGLEWTVVYLSNDRNNDPVVTLLLKDSSQLQSDMYAQSTYSNSIYASTYYDVDKYTEGRYSTSLLRSKLNLGIAYAISTTQLELDITKFQQQTGHPLAVFTMTEDELASAGKHSLMKYIDMPYLIPYQQSESVIYLSNNSGDLNNPNAAYGCTAGQGTTYSNPGPRGYWGKAAYDFNSYTLNNYIVEKTGNGTRVDDGKNNQDVVNNMDLSDIFGGNLYDASKPDGKKWKNPSDWTSTELSEVRKWTDAESWAFDPVWIPSLEEFNKNAYTVEQFSIWKCSVNQTKYAGSGYYWLRSLNNGNVTSSYVMDADDGVSIANSQSHSSKYYIRPALHLNLAQAEANAVKVLKAPQNITLDYDGKVQNVDHAAKATTAAWYDGTLYSTGVDITYSPDIENGKDKLSTNVGEYEATIKLDKSKAWEDATDTTDKERKIKIKVNPAPINVDFTKGSGFSPPFGKTNDYVYHTKESKHALKFPEDVETWDNVIQLPNAVQSDKDNIEIRYCTDEHEEGITDHSAYLKKVQDELLPQVKAQEESLWFEYTPDKPKLNVDAPKGYCVFYRIKSPNYKTEYGYFSVHIATEELIVGVSKQSFDPYVYGSEDIPTTKGELKTLAETVITEAKAGEEDRLSKLDKSKFEFYLIDQSGTPKYFPDEEPSKPDRLDVGTYKLAVKYVDGDKSEYIHCKFKDDLPPTFEIKPKFISVEWTGNPNWNDDKEKVSQSANSYLLADDNESFNYVYKNEPQCPTAQFTDLDGNKINLKISDLSAKTDAAKADYSAEAELINKDTGKAITNYTFEPDGSDGGQTKNNTHIFRIHKSVNWWRVRYSSRSLGLNQELNFTLPEPFYGEKSYVQIKYYKDEDYRDEVSSSDVTKEAGTYYVLVTFDGEDNFDGLDSRDDVEFANNYKIKVSACTHAQCTPWLVYENDSSKHTRQCQLCEEVFIEDHAAKTDSAGKAIYSSDDTSHWQICKDCNEKFGSSAHSEHAMAGTKEPTCTDTGVSEGIECPVCGKVLVAQNVIPALGHRFGDDAEEVAATCTENGFRRGKCKVCENTATEILPALGHTLAHHPEKEATETENGNIEYWNCSVCGKYFNDGEGTHEIAEANTVVPALGVSGGSGSQGGTTGGDSQGGNQNNNNLSDGLSGGTTGGSNDFLKDNWWWIVLIVGVLILLMLLFIIITTVNSRRRDRERQRQFDTLIKMQMMHYGFGQGGYQAGNTADETMHVEGQPRAQLPYSQEMIDVAVAAAMSALNQMNEKKPDTSSSADSGKSVHDADGFYENYKPDDDNNE